MKSPWLTHTSEGLDQHGNLTAQQLEPKQTILVATILRLESKWLPSKAGGR